MDNVTIQQLNQINHQFYQITAESFDESRSQPWTGWEVLLPYLAAPLTVLDVGCGNGRFGLFLAEKLGAPNLTYYGLDSNPTLLDRARAALSGFDAHFEQRDIITQPPDSGTYDLVTLFGLLHHIPWPDDMQVEQHDYLLDWRRDVEAVRYCHYVDDAEHADLIAATGLTEITTYDADGRTNDLNRYSLLRRYAP